MLARSDIIGATIKCLLESPPVSNGVAIKEFGEYFWQDVVIELNSGLLVRLWEFEISPYEGDSEVLKPAVVLQQGFSSDDINGRKVLAVTKDDGGVVSVRLDNGVVVLNLGGPGGNQIWLERKSESDENRFDYWSGESAT